MVMVDGDCDIVVDDDIFFYIDIVVDDDAIIIIMMMYKHNLSIYAVQYLWWDEGKVDEHSRSIILYHACKIDNAGDDDKW